MSFSCDVVSLHVRAEVHLHNNCSVVPSCEWQITVLETKLERTNEDYRWKANAVTNILSLPVMYVCDCRRPVAKDPGLDVHGSCFRVRYGHIYYPLQAFTLVTCHGRNTNTVKWVGRTRWYGQEWIATTCPHSILGMSYFNNLQNESSCLLPTKKTKRSRSVYSTADLQVVEIQWHFSSLDACHHSGSPS